MWPADLAKVLADNLKDPRIKSVTRYADLDRPPKPEGVRVVDSDGKTWDFSIVTSSPDGGGHLQTGWD